MGNDPSSTQLPDSAAALVHAAMTARAHPELLDASSLRRRLSALVAAAEGAPDSLFLDELASAAPALMGYLLSFELEGTPSEFVRSYVGDAFGRFLHTLDMTPRPLRGSVLEIGANPYLFHLLLRTVFPRAAIVGSNFFDHDIFSTRIGRARHRLTSSRLGEVVDFDFPTFNVETVHPYPFPAASFDLVFFCETLEHLVVNPLRVFREVRRILRPGGHLLLTLPNALRWTNVAAMIAGRNFFDLYWVGNGVHGRHNREYSVGEVRTLLERDGFEIVRAETRDRLDYDVAPIEVVDYSGPASVVPLPRTELEHWIRQAGGVTSDRGDNIYVLARRPVTVASIRPRDSGSVAAPGMAPPPLPDDPRLVSFLDVLETAGDRLLITGWAFYTDDNSGLPAEVDVVVRGQDRSTVHRAEEMPRADVASAHGLELDAVGFTVVVPLSALPPPPFEVRLRVRSSSGKTAERLLQGSEATARRP